MSTPRSLHVSCLSLGGARFLPDELPQADAHYFITLIKFDHTPSVRARTQTYRYERSNGKLSVYCDPSVRRNAQLLNKWKRAI